MIDKISKTGRCIRRCRENISNEFLPINSNSLFLLMIEEIPQIPIIPVKEKRKYIK